MLFKVEGTEIHLLASMHLLPQEWHGLRPFIWQAYDQSQMFYFEDNVLNPRFPFPPMKNDSDGFYPWARALISTHELATEIGLFSECGIDSQLLVRAMEERKNIGYLDTENACNAFARAPVEEQQSMLDMVLEQPEKAKSMLQNIYTTWRDWNVPALEKLLEDQFALFPETYHDLITLRNEAWGAKIKGIISAGTPALISVGALHFVGVNGIGHQVEKLGFQLVAADVGR